MRILELASCRGHNGAAGHCWDLARLLRERGHEVTIGCRSRAWIGRQAVEEGLPVMELDMGRWPREIRDQTRQIRAAGFDVVHTHSSRAHLFGVIQRRITGIPVVATAHSRLFQPHWAWNDRVIAVSQATADFHQRVNLVPRSRMRVIPNFVDAIRFGSSDRSQRASHRESLGFAPETVVILVVGHVEPRKGLLHLVRALPAILRVVPQALVVAAGAASGAYAEQTIREARRLGVEDHVRLLGKREDVPTLLAAADCYCLPSEEEQMPLSVLEAMAAGLPVVATTVGGLRECIADGQDGLLVKPKSPRRLAEGITRITSAPEFAEGLGRSAAEKIRTQFAPERRVRQIEAVLSEAARRKGRRAA